MENNRIRNLWGWIWCAAAVCLILWAAQVPYAFAAEEMQDPEHHSITGFAPMEQAEFYFSGHPSEEELAAALPQTIEVYLDKGKKPVEIPVSWEAVEDFEDTEFYVYSMRPVWSDQYTIAKGLDPQTDVVWAITFRQNSSTQIRKGEGRLDIPAEDLQKLEPAVVPEDEEPAPDEETSSGLSGGNGWQALKTVLSLCGEESYAKTDSSEKKIYRYLTDKMGLNMAAACGVMTNLYAESGMQSNNLENVYNARYGLSDKEYTKRVNKGKKHNGRYVSGFGTTRYFTTDYCGYGICQWTTSGRRTKLLKAAVKKDVSIANLEMQLGILRKELKNDYPQVMATLQGVPNTAAGAYLAAAHFCASFEIPANTVNTSLSRGKTALATYWKNYSGKTASASGKSYLGLCGYAYPETLRKGDGMTVSGQVISNYNIKRVRARILNRDGETVYSGTSKPRVKIFSLYQFDRRLLFSKLPAGSYTYVITAKDAKGRTVTVKHGFRVSSKSKTESKILRGCATKNRKTSAK